MADSGVDQNNRKPESVVNILGWKKQKIGTLASLFLCFGLMSLWNLCVLMRPKIIFQGTIIFIISISLGYLYQGPPVRLSYNGLGEPLCFLAFGPLATTALYLSMMPLFASIDFGVIPTMLITLSAMVGVSTTIILFSSHFHQVDG